MGFNCHMPRVVIYGTHKFGGFQLAHLYLEQGTAAIRHFLGHVQEMALIGEQIMINLSQCQLVGRKSRPFLNKVESNMSYVPMNWLHSIRKFLWHCDSNLVIPDAWAPVKQRTKDVFLMDVFASSSPQEAALLHVNTVQLYLQVFTLADIVDKSGSYILPWDLTGSTQAMSTLDWPNQTKPFAYAWRIWRAFLRNNFASTVLKSTQLNRLWALDTSLGTWLVSKPYTLRQY
eukprot:6233655-Ditylum_brightwellii.AAC.1